MLTGRIQMCCHLARKTYANIVFLQAYAQENGLAYWETSAKSNTNVNDVFVDIAKRLPQAQAVQATATGIQLTEQAHSQPRKSGCC
jgi:hypothetical protein